MRNYFLLFVCLGYFTIQIPAQSNRSSIREMTLAFADVYSKTNKKDNFFGRLIETSKPFFSIYNRDFLNSVIDIKNINNIGIDSASYFIYDSVMMLFSRKDYLWEDHPQMLTKFTPYFLIYNEKLCGCLTSKLKLSKSTTLNEKSVNECVSILITDTGYLNKIKQVAGSFTMNEISDAMQPAGIYIYQNCPAMYQYFNTIIKDISLGTFIYDMKQAVFTMDTSIVGHFRRNELKELKKIFPSYKLFEDEIRSQKNMMDKQNRLASINNKTVLSGKIQIVKTFYSYLENDHPELFGQLSFILKDDNFGSPILSFKFTKPEKIKDRIKILKKLRDDGIEMPPPPPIDNPPGVEIIKDVRIDTLQKRY